MSIAVIGAGAWGRALHFAVSKNFTCKITSRTKRELDNFVTLKEAIESRYLIFAISSQSARDWLESNFRYDGQKVLVAMKGIEKSSGMFLNEIFSKYIPEENLAFLSGPSFAKEVLESLPTALVINSKNLELSNEFSSFFPDFIKVYCSDDVIGAEVAGAYKNVLAIAGGICAGLNLGNNAKASLISRGLVEMARFGKFFGAKEDTFIDLSGAGDLFLSASSELSRNYRVGLGLAEGRSLENILKELGEVAEGVFTTEAILKLSEKHDIHTPIAYEVGNVLNGKNPYDSLRDLLK